MRLSISVKNDFFWFGPFGAPHPLSSHPFFANFLMTFHLASRISVTEQTSGARGTEGEGRGGEGGGQRGGESVSPHAVLGGHTRARAGKSQAHTPTGTQAHGHTGTQTHRHTDTQTHRHTGRHAHTQARTHAQARAQGRATTAQRGCGRHRLSESMACAASLSRHSPVAALSVASVATLTPLLVSE